MKTNKRLFIIYYYTEFSSHVLVSHLKFVSQILSMTCSLSYESVSHVCLTCLSHIYVSHSLYVSHKQFVSNSLYRCPTYLSLSHIYNTYVSHSLYVSHIGLAFTVCLTYLSLLHCVSPISVSHSFSASYICLSFMVCLSFVACFTYVCLINRLSHICVSYSLSVSNICLSFAVCLINKYVSFTVIFTLHENKYEYVSFCSLSHKSVSHFHFVSNVSLLFARIGHNLE